MVSEGGRIISHMKRMILAAALLGLAAAPLAAGGKGTVTGSYVEARTAEVFTGGCIMNSEAETVGKQAVLAWKVDHGSFNGIAIDGLSVVAAVSGDRNLGMTEMGGAKPAVRSALFVDERANPAQRLALVAMANELSNGLVGTIVQVAPTPIQFSDRGGEIQVSAGPASLDVSKHLDARSDLRRDAVVPSVRHDRRRGDGRDRAARLHGRGARHEVERPEQAVGVLRHVLVLTPSRVGQVGRVGQVRTAGPLDQPTSPT